MSLLDLFKSRETRKRELMLRINETRAAVIEARRALSLVDKLKKEIPERIAIVRSSYAGIPFIHSLAPAEDALDIQARLLRQVRAEESLRRLADDLPAIEKHWRARLEKLEA